MSERPELTPPPFHAEPAAFALAWLSLAVVGYVLEGWIAAAALSVGLMVVLMPASAFLITRDETFRLERTVRWSILITAGAGLALVHALGS